MKEKVTKNFDKKQLAQLHGCIEEMTSCFLAIKKAEEKLKTASYDFISTIDSLIEENVTNGKCSEEIGAELGKKLKHTPHKILDVLKRINAPGIDSVNADDDIKRYLEVLSFIFDTNFYRKCFISSLDNLLESVSTDKEEL